MTLGEEGEEDGQSRPSQVQRRTARPPTRAAKRPAAPAICLPETAPLVAARPAGEAEAAAALPEADALDMDMLEAPAGAGMVTDEFFGVVSMMAGPARVYLSSSEGPVVTTTAREERES